MKTGLAFLTVFLLFGLQVGVANAASELSPRMESAIERVKDGSWTKADLVFIKSKPNIAKYVPDPRPSGTTSRDKSGTYPKKGRAKRSIAMRDIFDSQDSQGTETSGGDGSCASNLKKRWYMAWVRRRSLLGSTIYRYHHKINYCTGGGLVRKFANRFDYISDAQSIINLRERVLNNRGGVMQPKTWSKMQRRLEYCLPVTGCYATVYPWVLLRVRYNGKIGYEGHA